MGKEFDCQTCKDTGYVCDVCREADGDCTCDDGPDLVACDLCYDGDGQDDDDLDDDDDEEEDEDDGW